MFSFESLFLRGGGALAALLLLSCDGRADQAPSISVTDGWTREVAAGQSSGAAYVTVANRGNGEDRLLGATTPVATDVTLHSSSNTDGITRMRRIADGVPIPANSTLELKPAGTHIMLSGLKQPLRAGQRFEMKLRFAKSGSRSASFHIMPAAAEGHHGGMHM